MGTLLACAVLGECGRREGAESPGLGIPCTLQGRNHKSLPFVSSLPPPPDLLCPSSVEPKHLAWQSQLAGLWPLSVNCPMSFGYL